MHAHVQNPLTPRQCSLCLAWRDKCPNPDPFDIQLASNKLSCDLNPVGIDLSIMLCWSLTTQFPICIAICAGKVMIRVACNLLVVGRQTSVFVIL